jgi:hypothetical protein
LIVLVRRRIDAGQLLLDFIGEIGSESVLGHRIVCKVAEMAVVIAIHRRAR